MHRLLSFIAVIVLLILTFIPAPAAFAKAGDPDAIFKRYKAFYAAGNFAAALVEAQKLEAAFKAQFGNGHPNYAHALTHVANVYFALGRYDQAEALFKRALAIREKAKGADRLGHSSQQPGRSVQGAGKVC